MSAFIPVGRRGLVARGFGLLEVIVALLILASSGLAMFSWVQQSLGTAAKLAVRQRESQLLLSAQALLAGVNPALRREGERELEGLRVTWRAELLEPMRRNAGFSSQGGGFWLVGLYRMNVTVEEQRSQLRLEYVQMKLGYRQATDVGVGL